MSTVERIWRRIRERSGGAVYSGAVYMEEMDEVMAALIAAVALLERRVKELESEKT